MKTQNPNLMRFLQALAIVVILSGCRQYDNFTTYFNTYYNANRLIKESEEEFEYQDEKKRVMPRVFVPEPKILMPAMPDRGTPPFLREFIVEQQKLQPVKIKLDSVIIKGSKILAKHPNSDYIQKTLYLMAKSFFYSNEWVPSEIKCSELIDKYPDGVLSPDAHILLVKNYLIQRKFLAGKVLLSRTVDVAWQLKRYDILSEAFRIEAELALYENNLDGAVKPYKQAIAQCDDNLMRAKWQVDMAALMYRIGKYELAEQLFAKVEDYSPDYVAEFEAKLYRGASLARLGKFAESEKILDDLASDGNNKEWLSNIFAERMNILRLQHKGEEFETAEKFADSAFLGSEAVAGVYFEKGMDLFDSCDYGKAKTYFYKGSNVRTPVSRTSNTIYKLLNSWEQKRSNAIPMLQMLTQGKEIGDSSRALLGLYLFELARIHEQLGNRDSAEYYYSTSIDVSPPNNNETARYIYGYARYIENANPTKSDSLMELVVEKYPLTEYGDDARKRQGYTDAFVIDTVAELYMSGSSLRKNKEYDFAIIQFSKIFQYYPQHKLTPKAIYTIGWIYENHLLKYDSALYYYQILLDYYPNTEYARDVRLSVSYSKDLRTSKQAPDSLLPKIDNSVKELPVDKPPQQPNQVIEQEPIKKDKDGFSVNPLDLLKSNTNPQDLLDKAKEAITDPRNIKEVVNTNLDSIINPLNYLLPDDSLSKNPKPLLDETEPDKPKEQNEPNKQPIIESPVPDEPNSNNSPIPKNKESTNPNPKKEPPKNNGVVNDNKNTGETLPDIDKDIPKPDSTNQTKPK